MRKLIVFIFACSISYSSYSQNLSKLNRSDLNNRQHVESNNLEDFLKLISNGEIGFAYLQPNNHQTFNVESGIKLIQITSTNIQDLNTGFEFASSVEMIVIDVYEQNFKDENINCNMLEQFKNLKYIYFRYQVIIENIEQTQQLNCLPATVKQFYSMKLPS